MRYRILCLVMLLGGYGCRTSPVGVARDDAHGKAPVVAGEAWSVTDLPPADISEKRIQDVIAKPHFGPGRHYLSIDTSGGDWVLADEQKTNDRLNKMEVAFLLNRIPIGKGDQGLANLRKIASMMPRGSRILAMHCLTCQTNQWSKKIHTIRREANARSGVTIVCDGAF